ncbi:type II toxin-antitoxin system RelE/ParE family toxin [Candidatus Palauibacter sp.]|uniref:type II toxin-antitoxin system RelE/ParE family toxin n=1 Tax=Candidatus Palauibacter sp. TaxID=3101350 RepID=UPI003B021672
MTPGSVVLREAASRDVEEAVDHYLEEAGPRVALGFIDALQGVFQHIADNPLSGSPRYGHEVNLPGLRSWPLKGYPHLIFYMAGHGQIDVWRVLHRRRDIPDWLRAS